MNAAVNEVVQYSDASLAEDLKQSSAPVLVDFYADWCQPCKALAPTIAELAKEYAGKVRIGKINVDANQEKAGELGIRSIPTVVVFKGGKVVAQATGLQKKQHLADMIQTALAG